MDIGRYKREASVDAQGPVAGNSQPRRLWSGEKKTNPVNGRMCSATGVGKEAEGGGR